MMNLAEKLKCYMRENGIKYSHVAVKAGINVKTFSAILNNRTRLLADDFVLICLKGLGVSPILFFEREVLENKNERIVAKEGPAA